MTVFAELQVVAVAHITLTAASYSAAVSESIGAAYGQACREQPKDQEGLCPGLILYIILDGVRQEVLVLKEDLQQPTGM